MSDEKCLKSKDHFDGPSFGGGFFIGFVVVGFGLTSIFACQESPLDVRKEAVEHHHASWVSDSKGQTHFEWIEPWNEAR